MKLKAPKNLKVAGVDGACAAQWDAVDGAEGYKLYFFSASEPENCIKIRYSQTCEKTISGFENNEEYLVRVRAYALRNSREKVGESSEKLSFTPVCTTLKAQKTICLKVGEKAQIKCERENAQPKIRSYTSSNDKIAPVDASGVVTARREGSCFIRITAADGDTFETRVEVERSLSADDNRAVIMLAGDIMCTLVQKRNSFAYDFNEAFSGLKETLSEADFSAGVLEAVCYDGAPYEDERLRLDNGSTNSNAPSTFLSAISNAGFSGVVTASNHNCDAGMAGLTATVSKIESLGMKNIGTLGRNPVIVSIKGIKVAFIAVCSVSNGLEETVADERHMTTTLGRFGRKNFERLVNRAKSRGAEYIIAYQHWGSMNTRSVIEQQTETAVFMANAGVDLIVGSHPHVIQKLSYIKTDDGRTVPCLYSLGNLLSTMHDVSENRDGIILRVELKKNSGKVFADFSYIPVCSENRKFGAAAVCAYPPHNRFVRGSFERTAKIIGRRLSIHAKRPKVMLSGSQFLRKIFKSGNDFRTDDTAVYISQISLGSTPVNSDEKCSKRLSLELTKDLSEYIYSEQPDYIAVDFYGAGTYSCLRMDDGETQSYFTNTKSFVHSEFYEKHKDELMKIHPPFGETIYKPLVRSYAEKLLSAAAGRQIILFRTRITSNRAKKSELRTVPAPERINKFVAAMEDYFIELVNPRVIDLSDKYFASLNSDDFEEDYFADAYKAFVEITSCNNRTYVDKPDLEMWFERVLKYYDSMTMRSYTKRLLDMNCAADAIIAKTSKDFAASHRSRLLKLKSAGNSELSSVREFFADDPFADDICRAAEIIDAVMKGGIERTYEFFRPAFVEKYNIVKSIAKILSAQTGIPVNESNAELVFLIRGKPQFRRYMSDLNMMTVDIWGSSVSREALNHCRDAKSGSLILKQPAILNYEPPIKLSFPESADDFHGSASRRKTYQDSFARNGFKVLEESNSSWILLDFYDLITRMAEHEGSMFELDDFLISTDFYADNRKYCTECFLFEKRTMDYCHEKITKFAEEIAELYGDNIILIKTEPKSSFISLDYKLEQFGSDKLCNIKKKFIALCEERFASVTKCFVIDISRKFYSSDKYTFGGANVVHYEDEFYRLAGAYISEILNGNTNKLYNAVDEDYILLRDLRLSR